MRCRQLWTALRAHKVIGRVPSLSRSPSHFSSLSFPSPTHTLFFPSFFMPSFDRRTVRESVVQTDVSFAQTNILCTVKIGGYLYEAHCYERSSLGTLDCEHEKTSEVILSIGNVTLENLAFFQLSANYWQRQNFYAGDFAFHFRSYQYQPTYTRHQSNITRPRINR